MCFMLHIYTTICVTILTQVATQPPDQVEDQSCFTTFLQQKKPTLALDDGNPAIMGRQGNKKPTLAFNNPELVAPKELEFHGNLCLILPSLLYLSHLAYNCILLRLFFFLRRQPSLLVTHNTFPFSANGSLIASVECNENMQTDYNHRTLILEIMKKLGPTSFEEFSQSLSLEMHLNLAVLLKGSR